MSMRRVRGAMSVTMRATTAAQTHVKQALAKLSCRVRKHICTNVSLVGGKYLNVHAGMLGVDLHHHMVVTVLGLTGLAQVEVMAH
jgi:hypothetical protein